MPLTFVLGTSRCGSTMLSKMLDMHPEVLSVSEFWNCFLETVEHIPTRDMTGEEFWQTINAPDPFYDELIRTRIKQDENIRPFPSRFSYIDGMPPFCRILAMTTGESPDDLYDELAPVVSAWPSRSTAAQCAALFKAMADRLGRPVIVERSGGSLLYSELLLREFSRDRFVFLSRDGADTSVSMSRHPIIRIHVMRILAEAIEKGSGEPESFLNLFPVATRMKNRQEFQGLIGPPYDRERFLNFPIPIAAFGWFWSDLTRTGVTGIRSVGPAEWMPLRYEDLLTDNRAQLTRLAEFLGVAADPGWLDKTSSFANPGRLGSAAAQLLPGDYAELTEACRPGAEAFDALESEFHTAAAAPR